MENANLLRVSGRPSAYSGSGNTPQDRQHQRRQKLLALFDAVEHGNLEASKLALKTLLNFDHSLATDAHFVRLSKALEAGGTYLAQQLVREIKAKFINATPLHAVAPKTEQASHPYFTNGMHFVDTRA
ncbi:hypothetical protein [Limnohabitans sp.]|uniref:hypothetical protein n=1 Tax=Limnohabitans sp. TaxID=1907725 RepID=UPI00334161BF